MLALATACATDSVQESKAPPARVEILADQPGTGRSVGEGVWIVMHYMGWIADPNAPDRKGKRFVSSRDRGEALSYLYGYRRAIPGLERGLEDMRAGGRRTIFIPPSLGYDDRTFPRPAEVPPRSALVFEIDLIDVAPASED